MSWEEYKKQRNNNSSNSWQNYKKKRESNINVNQQILLPSAQNTKSSQIPLPVVNTVQNDADKYGTFSNGYQPKGIDGHGNLSKTGQTINVQIGESDTYNELTGKKDKVFNKQNVWKAEDGTKWVWDGTTRTYKPYGESAETGLMTDINKQNVLPVVERGQENVITNAINASKLDEQRKKNAGIGQTFNPLRSGFYVGKNILEGFKGSLPQSMEALNSWSKGLANQLGMKAASKILGIDTDNEIVQNVSRVTVEKIADNTAGEQLNDIINSEEAKQLRNEKIQQNIIKAEREGGQIGKYLAEQAPSIGNNLFNMAISAVNPVIGTTSFITSAAGGYLDEGRNLGMTEDQALMYSLIMGVVEGGTESVISGSMLESGAKLFGVNGVAKEGLHRVVNSFGFNILENFAQEAITEPLNELTKQVVAGKEFANWDNIGERAFKAGFDGAISSIILGGFSVGINSCAYVYEKSERGEQVTQEEIKKAITDAEKAGIPVNEILAESIKENIEAITAQGNINQASQSNISDFNNQVQQTTQEYMNQAQNQVREQTSNIVQDLINYNNSRQEGQEIFDLNNEQNKNELSAIQKIANDRGINIQFDENRFNDNTRNAFYEYDNNGNIAKIVLNPNSASKKYVQDLVVHELVHSFSGKQQQKLINDVFNYAKTLEGFDKAYQDIRQSYEKVYGKNVSENVINEEVVANILGQKLGSQEFINDLVNGKYATQNRNWVQKIYDFVKNQINRFRGYKDQERYWTHIKEMFDDAYRNSEINKQGNKYSIGGERARTANIQQLKEAQKLKDEGLSDEEIYKQTGWYIGNEGKWRFEIDDTNFKFKDNLKENTNYWLDNVFDAKELYDAYPQLKGIDVKFIDLPNNISGGYYEIANSMILNKDLLKNITDREAKKTILHEIQHAIQGYEDFTKGSNGADWEDTKRRLDAKLTELNDRLEYYHNENGFYDYQKNLVDNMDKYTIDEFFNLLEQYDTNSQYAEQINELKAKINKVELEYSKIKNRTLEDLYKNTGGEQESKNVEERVELPPEERKQIMPFTKDENTVYPIDKTLVYEYNGNKYQISLKGDIKNGEDFVHINDSNKRFESQRNESNRYKGNGTEQRNTNDRKNTRIAETKNGINERQTLPNSKRSEFENIKDSKQSSFSLQKDNQGRKLSKEQAEYFKDSKVRDENGNLLTMYHGTPNGDYTIFKNGSYFTSRKEYADGYQNTWASAISTKQNANNPKTYEVYLNITNPFTLQNSKAKDIYLNEFIKGGNSLSYDPYTNWEKEINQLDEIDWTEAEDLREWLIENHPEYDGLVLDEGGDGGYGEAEYSWRGKSYVPFNANQIKKVDNTNPTTNEDIRFSKDTSGDWNNFLEKNFKKEGTGTSIKDMKALPTKQITMQDFEDAINEYNFPTKDANDLRNDLKYIEMNKQSLDDFKDFLRTYNEAYQETLQSKEDEILDTTKTYSTGRKEIYRNYLNDNSKYDRTALERAKEIIPGKQGRRTKEQWLSIAKQIGTEIANKSNEEIEKIAYRSWLDEAPNQKSQLNRQGQKFVKFNSDDWINAIYNQVKDVRQQFSVETEDDNWSIEQINEDNLQRTNALKEAYKELQKIYKQSKDKSFLQDQYDKFDNLEGKTNNDYERLKYRTITDDIQGVILGRKSILDFEETQDFLKDLKEENLPTQLPTAEQTEQSLPIKEEPNIPVAEQTTEENLLEKGKSRKHYETYSEAESLSTKDRNEAKKLYKQEQYVPVGNLETLTNANSRIERNGLDNEYTAMNVKFNNNEKMTLDDIVTMERMIQMYSAQGDSAKVNNLMQNVAIMGTELGQRVQALSIIKRMSPEGQLQLLNKLVERTNQKENSNLKITDEQADRILKSNGEKELNDNVTKVVEEIAQDLEVTFGDEVRAWRYLSMLGNPRTHIRNLLGNVAMNTLQNSKNKLAGAGEDLASLINPNLERTKTLRMANQDQRDFAKKDAFLMEDMIDGGGKYDMKNILQEAKRTSKLKVLNAIEKFNSNLLDKEDKIFLRKAYEQAMRGYMAANKLSSKDMEDSVTLEKARKYATLQAQEATFHQYSALASKISQIEREGGAMGFLTSAILPFKKTPINIAKTGIEYSPIGIISSVGNTIKNVNKDTKTLRTQLQDGKITQEQYNSEISNMVNKRIDQMSKGLTGTALAVLGYALAKQGILKAGNGDDEDEFEEKLGKQTYSVTIGDNNFSLDWLAPSAIPLFVGANFSYLANGDENSTDDETMYDRLGKSLNTSATSLMQAFEPMTEMSMLQGLASTLSSYEQDSSNKLFDIGSSAIQSYAGQFVPTALGQVAKTIDPTVRDTTSTKKGVAKKIDQFINQTKNKIPGLSYTLPVKTDVWGEEKTRPENIIVRSLENAVLPYNREQIIEDTTSKKLKEVYEETGTKGVLPSTPQKYITLNSQRYNLNNTDFNKSKKVYGQTAKAMLDDVIDNSNFTKLNSESKAKIIGDIYLYAKEEFKLDYAERHNIDYTAKVRNSSKKYEMFKNYENGNTSLKSIIDQYYKED